MILMLPSQFVPHRRGYTVQSLFFFLFPFLLFLVVGFVVGEIVGLLQCLLLRNGEAALNAWALCLAGAG